MSISIGAFTIILFACLILSVILGSKLKINVGIFAFILAFALAVFVLGYKPSALWKYYPVSIVCNTLFITYFFGFARKTKSLEFIVDTVLYALRKVPFLLPFIGALFGAFFVSIGVLGPTAAAILVPIFMEAAYRLNWSRRGMFVCFSTGVMGALFVKTSVVGGVLRGMLAMLLPDLDSNAIADAISRGSVIVNIVVFIVGYVVYKGWKIAGNKDAVEGLFQKPEKPTTAQKVIVAMIGAIVLIVIIPKIFSSVPLFAAISAKTEITFLYLLCGLICSICRFAPEREVFATMPWPMFFLLGGTTTLFALAGEVGVATYLGELVSTHVSPSIVIFVISIVGGVIGFFSDALGVVLPLMLPIGAAVAMASGCNVTSLCSGVVIASFISGVSPVSTVGALVVSICRQEEQNKMFVFSFVFAIAATVLAALMAQLGII